MIEVCLVLDTHENDFFETPKGKSSWSKVGHAKNAWNAILSKGYGGKKFNEQSRYVVKRLIVTPTVIGIKEGDGRLIGQLIDLGYS